MEFNRNLKEYSCFIGVKTFMCSFTACQHNKASKDQFYRIVNKGKSKKPALLAVSNKLLRQAFAISKSGIPIDTKHRSQLTQV